MRCELYLNKAVRGEKDSKRKIDVFDMKKLHF